MSKTFKKIAAATALILAASASFASEPNTFYAGADLGRTKFDGWKHHTSVGAFVGYNFHQNFAVEGGYRRLADADVYVGTMNGDVAGNYKAHQAQLSVVGTLPMGERLSLYGRLGVNRLESKTSSGAIPHSYKSDGTEALYGAGLSYALSPTISARIEAQKPANDTTNVSAGVAFRF